MRFVAALFAALAIHHPAHHHHHRVMTVRGYARQLVLHRWHSVAEWNAENEIVQPESGWDPCAAYPGIHDCTYRGINSCGIPQRDPCPIAWRGRLWLTRWEQVRDLQAYIAGRYGDPLHALAFHQAHGWY